MDPTEASAEQVAKIVFQIILAGSITFILGVIILIR
jgi:hypothetical protein